MRGTSRARSLARRVLGRPPSAAAVHAVKASEYASADTPVLVTIPPSRGEAGGPPARLTVLMPHLELKRMTGGPNTVINLTGRLVDLGVPVRYVATYGPLDRDEAPLRAHIERLTGSAAAGREVQLVGTEAPFPVAQGDVLMATWWPTAWVARDALRWTRSAEFVYLIQDFEPGFYAWSTNYALAEATYGFPCRAVFNERLLRDHFAAAGVGLLGADDDERAVAFDPSVDRGLFARPAHREPGAPRRLLLYARPKPERNLFPLALKALRTAVQAGVFDGEDWEFSAIGSDVPSLALDGHRTLRPAGWLGYADYARLISGSDLLLSLMLSPHTSYPPIEMATAGNLVVTNTYGAKTADALHAISPRISGVPATEEALVEALRDAVAAIREDRIPGGDAALPGSWDDALADAVPWLARTVRELARGPADAAANAGPDGAAASRA